MVAGIELNNTNIALKFCAITILQKYSNREANHKEAILSAFSKNPVHGILVKKAMNDIQAIVAAIIM